MDQLTINNNIKYDTIINLVRTKDFYIVFSNERERSIKATVNAKATLDSLFTKGKIDLVFVAKVDKDKDVWLAAPNRTAAEKDFPAGYNFFKIEDTTEEDITTLCLEKDITTLFFRKEIEANDYAQFNVLSLVYCEAHEADFLGGKYDYTDPEDEETGAPQPDANPFIDHQYNFRILAQVRPASLIMNKPTNNKDDITPKLELLIEF
jgi:hypothetical protein